MVTNFNLSFIICDKSTEQGKDIKLRSINLKGIKISNSSEFIFIGGPCVMESYDVVMFHAESIKKICSDLKIPFIFKSSFDKANRSSIMGSRGIGIDEGLEILSKVKESLDIPVLTDVHLPEQCEKVASVADILQIPAFLSRQTDLLESAAKTGKIIHIKKGQFMAPHDMNNVVKKMEHFGNENLMLCDRGVSFGYNTLVSDFRCLPIMSLTGYPVIFDATHSIQLPSSNGTCSGGQREFAPILARAAVAVGVAGIFMEVHESPDKAPCDGPNMIYLKDLKQVLTELQCIDRISKNFPRSI